MCQNLEGSRKERQDVIQQNYCEENRDSLVTSTVCLCPVVRLPSTGFWCNSMTMTFRFPSNISSHFFLFPHRWASTSILVSAISDIRHRHLLFRYRKKICWTENCHSDTGRVPISTSESIPISDIQNRFITSSGLELKTLVSQASALVLIYCADLWNSGCRISDIG